MENRISFGASVLKIYPLETGCGGTDYLIMTFHECNVYSVELGERTI